MNATVISKKSSFFLFWTFGAYNMQWPDSLNDFFIFVCLFDVIINNFQVFPLFSMPHFVGLFGFRRCTWMYTNKLQLHMIRTII